MSKHQKIGSLGEEIATMFLVKNGYRILERNFRRSWGELDIVAEKSGILHFVEVKSVSDETIFDNLSTSSIKDYFRPEDNVTHDKLLRLGRIIKTYLHSGNVSSETPWEFDVVTVKIEGTSKKAKINFIGDLAGEL